MAKLIAGVNDLATTHPVLAAQWHPTLNGDLTPQRVTRGSHKWVWWACEGGHEWQTPIKRRSLRGTGCGQCLGISGGSGPTVTPGVNDLATTHPALAAQWHPTRNGDLTPKHVSHGSGKRVWWQCEHGHDWDLSVEVRSGAGSKSGCPVCAGRRADPGVTDLATTHPALAAQWHPTLNGDLTPQHVSYGSGKRIWWLHEDGHEWVATPHNRGSNTSCAVCGRRRVQTGVTDLATTRPDVAAQWHPTRNGDLTPHHVAGGSMARVWWQCENGHQWAMTVARASDRKDLCRVCSTIDGQVRADRPRTAG